MSFLLGGVTLDSNETLNLDDLDQSQKTISTLDKMLNAVNDAPVVGALANAEIDEDGSYQFTLSADDVDNDNDSLEFSATSDNVAVAVAVDGVSLTATPDADYFGSATITVSVSDGDLGDSTSFTLTVNPVNDAPIINTIADQNIDEDNSLILTLSAFDVDQDALYYTASIDGNASVSVSGNQLILNPDADFYGTILVNVQV